MLRILLDYFYPSEYIWRNQDSDIPVTFIKVAGVANGVEYAQVSYEGVVSFVPMKELITVRKRHHVRYYAK